MTQYTGSSPNIQRKIRRFYEALKELNPNFKAIAPGELLFLIKALAIAFDEDNKNFNNVIIDEATNSLLPGAPFDTDA